MAGSELQILLRNKRINKDILPCDFPQLIIYQFILHQFLDVEIPDRVDCTQLLLGPRKISPVRLDALHVPLVNDSYYFLPF